MLACLILVILPCILAIVAPCLAPALFAATPATEPTYPEPSDPYAIVIYPPAIVRTVPIVVYPLPIFRAPKGNAKVRYSGAGNYLDDHGIAACAGTVL